MVIKNPSAFCKSSINKRIKKQFISLGVILASIPSIVLAAPPVFTSALSPTTIGVGAISTLTFTIDNSAESIPVSGVTFTNTLPTNVTIASPNNASTNCLNGSYAAVSGESSFSLSDYRLGLGQTCSFSIDITSTTPGAYVNTAGNLSTSSGSSSADSKTLTVDGSRPGFSMAFSPSSVTPNQESTLTYTIDNSSNGNGASRLQFTNTLPAGLTISNQPNSSSTCPLSDITVIPLGGSITFKSFGSLSAGATCTVSVDVVATNPGLYNNVSGALTQNGLNSSGTASATLTVSSPLLNVDFPASVSPGISVPISFTLTNTDRRNDATDITFTNDFNATLSGLAATVLPSNGFCGAGSTISGSSTITISGASLPSGGSCTFNVTVLVPNSSAAGTYTNNTSIVNYTLGSPTTSSAFTSDLVVLAVPTVLMEFIDDPVSVSGDVTLRYTITNTDSVNAVSALAFNQFIDKTYPGITIKTLPIANSCGAGSTFTSSNDGAYNFITVSDGQIPAGDTCTFDTVLTLPDIGPVGEYLHQTETITSTISGKKVYSSLASDSLEIRSAPSLSLAITEESIAPDGTLTAEFTLNYSVNAVADATNTEFTVDLNSALVGLVSTSGAQNDICGTGLSFTGTSTLIFSNGTLSPDTSCTFMVSLKAPADAIPGTYTVTSSNVTADTAGVSVTSGAVNDSFIVSGLVLTKSFVGSPTLPGASIVLRYSITNSADGLAATAMQFTDDLSNVVSSMAAISLPSTPCNGSSTITGATSLTFSGGELNPGQTCTFDVPIQVPWGASVGNNISASSTMTATVNGNNTESDSASATLIIEDLTSLLSSSVGTATTISPISVDITFSRPVINFVIGDLVINNGTASNLSGSGDSYTVDITPTPDTIVTIDLAAGMANDSVVNSYSNKVASQLAITHTTPPSIATPSVTVGSPSLTETSSGPVSYPVTYTNASEVSLSAAGITLNNSGTNATITVTNGSTDTPTVTLSGISGDGTIGITVNSETARNGIKKSTASSPSATVAVDNTAPIGYSAILDKSVQNFVNATNHTRLAVNVAGAEIGTVYNYSIGDGISTVVGSATIATTTNTIDNIDVSGLAEGTLTLSYTLTDDLGNVGVAITDTIVKQYNDAPVITQGGAVSVIMSEDGSPTVFSLTLNASDQENETITWRISTPATTGVASVSGTGNSNIISYVSPTNFNGNDSFSIEVTDNNALEPLTDLISVNVQIKPENDAPVVTSTASTTINEDVDYSYTLTATDIDASTTLTYSAPILPTWLSFNVATGILSGTPGNADVGNQNVTLRVNDGTVDVDQSFVITVSNANDAPVVSSVALVTAAEDNTYNYTFTATDVDVGSTLTFSAPILPTWLTFNAATGLLSGIPTNTEVGNHNVSLRVSDGIVEVDQTFVIIVSNSNDIPIVTSTAITTVNEDANYSYTLTATDVDVGTTLTFSAPVLPTWLNFNATTGVLSGTPSNAEVGSQNVTLRVNDGTVDIDQAFIIIVSNTNDVPVISSVALITATEDNIYNYSFIATDIDTSTTLTFSAPILPTWLTFNATTGLLSGTPTNSEVGNHNVSLKVSDGIVDIDQNFVIVVSNSNDAPVLTSPVITTVNEDAVYSYTLTATDIDAGTTLTFSAPTLPTWLSFNAATGILTGMPGNAEVGNHNVTLRINDGIVDVDHLFVINVYNTNDAPAISSVALTTAAEDNIYSYRITATDIDVGSILTFSAPILPSWLTFSASTGLLSGTPTNTEIGSHNVALRVSDGIVDVNQNFAITVSNGNDAPVVTSTAVTTVNEDAGYTYTLTATDVDAGTTLTFSAPTLPTWLGFNAATGILTGTPSNAEVGNHNVTLRVNDGVVDVEQAFVIIVSNTNDAPVVTSTAITTVNEGAIYNYGLTATDADVGTILTFSAPTLPTWLGFNTITGILSGTPSNAEVGNHNVTLRVNDGVVDVDQAFIINVSNANDTPVITSVALTTAAQESLYSYTFTAKDVDADSILTFSAPILPTWLTFNTSTGLLSGTPTNTEVGNHNVTLRVNDGNVDVDQAFVIIVSNGNDAPVIFDEIMSIEEDNELKIELTGTDSNEDNLIFSLMSEPKNGLLKGEAPNLIFIPNKDFNGEDSFTFKANDGKQDSEIATVFIEVIAVNDEPIAIDDELSINNWDPVEINVLINDKDVDGDQLIIQGASTETGKVTWTDHILTYIPNKGFSGAVIIKYSISDNQKGDASAQVLVNVNVDDIGLPVINTPADVEVNSNAWFTRVDLGIATAVDRFGEKIPVKILGGLFFESGLNTVTWQAVDEEGLTSEKNQLVKVHPLISLDKAQTVLEGFSVKLKVSLNGESPSYPLEIPYNVSGTANINDDYIQENGVVVINSGTEGFISFDILADGESDEGETIVVSLDESLNRGSNHSHTMTITERNITPQVELSVEQNENERFVVYQQNGLVEIKAKVIHPDINNEYNYIWSNQEQLITDIDVQHNSFSFDPLNLDVGIYHIDLTVTDVDDPEFSNTNSVTIKVEAMPVVLGSEDTDGDGIPDNVEGLSDDDKDGIPNYLDNIAECSVIPVNVTSNVNFLVQVEAGVCLRLGDTALEEKSHSVSVLEGNNIDEGMTHMGGIFDFSLRGLPVVGDSYSIVLPLTQPIPSNAVYRKFIPGTGWMDFVETENDQYWSTQGERGFCPPPGHDSWEPGLQTGHWCVQLLIQDGGFNDADGRANGTIVDPSGVAVLLNNNRLPIAVDDIVETRLNTSINIDALSNDTDEDFDDLTLNSASTNFGTVTILDNQLFYQPAEDFLGDAVITYGLSDGLGGSSSANVNVVVSLNTSPVANNDVSSLQAGQQININVLINDTDAEKDSLQVVSAIAEQGTAIINADNSLTYAAPTDFNGIDIITYRVRDAFGGEAVGQVQVTVAAIPILVKPKSGGGSINGLLLVLMALTVWKFILSSLLLTRNIKLRVK